MKEDNLDVIQGDTLSLTVYYKDNTSQQSAIDISDYTAEFQVRDFPGGNRILADIDESNGIVIDGPAGKITITISSDLTKTFMTPRSAYQLQISSGSVKTTLAHGWISVNVGVIP